MLDPVAGSVAYQKQLFALLHEVFERATGYRSEKFATFETFPGAIRGDADALAKRMKGALMWADDNLKSFYAQESANAFAYAREIGGLKLVQGGGSGFLKTQFSSIRASVLYADTVLIPDPVSPWFEAAREEEAFRHVKLLEAIFGVLHLKPLIDADLPTLPVFVFPSMEKILDENDPHTQVNSKQIAGMLPVECRHDLAGV